MRSNPAWRNPHFKKAKDAEGTKQTLGQACPPPVNVSEPEKEEALCHEGGSGNTWGIPKMSSGPADMRRGPTLL